MLSTLSPEPNQARKTSRAAAADLSRPPFSPSARRAKAGSNNRASAVESPMVTIVPPAFSNFRSCGMVFSAVTCPALCAIDLESPPPLAAGTRTRRARRRSIPPPVASAPLGKTSTSKRPARFAAVQPLRIHHLERKLELLENASAASPTASSRRIDPTARSAPASASAPRRGRLRRTPSTSCRVRRTPAPISALVCARAGTYIVPSPAARPADRSPGSPASTLRRRSSAAGSPA